MKFSASHLDRYSCKLIYEDSAEFLFSTKLPTKKRYANRAHSYNVYKLECFIDDLLSTKEIPFLPCVGTNGRIEFDRSILVDNYFRLVPGFLETVSLLSSDYEYNELIEAFRSCSEALGLFGKQLVWNDIWRSPHTVYTELGGRTVAELFNQLVSDIRRHCKTERVRSKITGRRHLANKRFTEYCRYVNALFADCSNLIVLRVDFSYQKEFFSEIDLQTTLKDMERFLNSKRSNALFNDRVGYIVKLEYAVEKGFHWHVILFFDGAERRKLSHIHFAQQMGEYWAERTTKGRGDYWNCNANIKDFMMKGICGIGSIHANDHKSRLNLCYRVVGYLCKTDQYFKPKCALPMKRIRKGEDPEIRPIKLGRPVDLLPLPAALCF